MKTQDNKIESTLVDIDDLTGIDNKLDIPKPELTKDIEFYKMICKIDSSIEVYRYMKKLDLDKNQFPEILNQTSLKYWKKVIAWFHSTKTLKSKPIYPLVTIEKCYSESINLNYAKTLGNKWLNESRISSFTIDNRHKRITKGGKETGLKCRLTYEYKIVCLDLINLFIDFLTTNDIEFLNHAKLKYRLTDLTKNEIYIITNALDDHIARHILIDDLDSSCYQEVVCYLNFNRVSSPIKPSELINQFEILIDTINSTINDVKHSPIASLNGSFDDLQETTKNVLSNFELFVKYHSN